MLTSSTRRALAIVLALPCALAHLPARADLPPRDPKKAAMPPAAPAQPAPAPAAPAGPPATRREPLVETLHGVQVADPYRWLETLSPETRAWMAAQDSFARARLAALPGRAQLLERLKQLAYLDTLGVPLRRGDRLFFHRAPADREKSILYWRPVAGGEPRVLLDPNTWSADGSTSMGAWSVSWDGKRIAYNVKANNSDEAVMQVMEIDSGQVSEVDRIEGAKYATASWTPDGRGFYYTWLPTDRTIPVDQRPGHSEIRFHALGTPPAQDKVVHARLGDPTKFQHADLSRDGRWLVRTVSHGWTRNDVFVMDLKAKAPRWMPIYEGRDGLFSPEVHKDRLYVQTTEGSPKGRVVVFDLAKKNPGDRKNERLLIAERQERILHTFSIVGGLLALQVMDDASNRLELFDLKGKRLREVALPGIGSTSAAYGLSDDPVAYFSFESFTWPREILEVDVRDGSTRSTFKLSVPVDPSGYEVTRVFGASKDGTKVPVFVVAKKGLPRDGSAPAILNGYGGFSVAMTPAFSATVYAWLEQGGVWAVSVLRGGSEYGDGWHRDGMRAKKQNVFDDYFAAAEALVREKFTSPKHLLARGGSNGGLLVGAALVQRPELWAGILCAVPLLDMVRYHTAGSGRTWISEYGSADDAEQFKTLFAYSPYHHVPEGKALPPVLLLSADADDRVDPLHARKMAAALQAANPSGNVLLRIEQHAGHGGADLRKAAVEQLADQFAFALAHGR